jgi:cytochrome P450
MMQTTFDIILKTMFSGGVSADVQLMERSVTDYLSSISWVVAFAMAGAPGWMPYPGMRKARCARKHFPQILDSLIDQAKHTHVDAVHRHKKLWHEPNRFDPSRFAPPTAQARDQLHLSTVWRGTAHLHWTKLC